MIYERIKELCGKKGLSINKLEQELGVAKGSLCRIDKHKPSSEKIQRLAEILQTSERYLMTGEDAPEYVMPEYDPREHELIEKFGLMNEEQKNIILSVMGQFKIDSKDSWVLQNNYGTGKSYGANKTFSQFQMLLSFVNRFADIKNDEDKIKYIKDTSNYNSNLTSDYSTDDVTSIDNLGRFVEYMIQKLQKVC